MQLKLLRVDRQAKTYALPPPASLADLRARLAAKFGPDALRARVSWRAPPGEEVLVESEADFQLFLRWLAAAARPVPLRLDARPPRNPRLLDLRALHRFHRLVRDQIAIENIATPAFSRRASNKGARPDPPAAGPLCQAATHPVQDFLALVVAAAIHRIYLGFLRSILRPAENPSNAPAPQDSAGESPKTDGSAGNSFAEAPKNPFSCGEETINDSSDPTADESLPRRSDAVQSNRCIRRPTRDVRLVEPTSDPSSPAPRTPRSRQNASNASLLSERREPRDFLVRKRLDVEVASARMQLNRINRSVELMLDLRQFAPKAWPSCALFLTSRDPFFGKQAEWPILSRVGAGGVLSLCVPLGLGAEAAGDAAGRRLLFEVRGVDEARGLRFQSNAFSARLQWEDAPEDSLGPPLRRSATN